MSCNYREVYNKYMSFHFAMCNDPSNYEAGVAKSYQYWRQYLRKYLPRNKDARILELGCGMGHHMSAIKRLGYANITGVDLSSECVEYCASMGLHVEHEDMVSYLSERPDCFDCIVMFHLLEHLSKDEAIGALRAIRASLRPGGSVIINSPNAECPFSTGTLYKDITHEMMYTKSSGRTLMLLAGFEDCEVFTTDLFTLWDTSAWMLILKHLFLAPLSWIGRTAMKALLVSQGLVGVDVKPMLILVGRKPI